MTKLWRRLNKRERMIATVTGIVVAGTILMSVYNRAMGYIEQLDNSIDTLETSLMQYTYQAARLEQVERDYSQIAGQHSSEWTQAEIHDRLRNEIHRLTFYNVPEPEALASGESAGAQMVNIPSYPAGSLDEQGEGYREYRLRINTRATSIANIARFVERLQQSDQLLRIERLVLTRQNPESPGVEATISISRAVIDIDTQELSYVDTPMIANLVRNPSFEEWDAEERQFAEWTVEGATVEACDEHVTTGVQALRATSAGSGIIYQLHELDPGETYDLALDVYATGAARFDILEDGTEEPFEGGFDIDPSDGYTRYMARFTVPQGGSAQRAVRAPAIRMVESGSSVTIDNVTLMPVRDE